MLCGSSEIRREELVLSLFCSFPFLVTYIYTGSTRDFSFPMSSNSKERVARGVGESSLVLHEKVKCLSVNELQRLDVNPELQRAWIAAAIQLSWCSVIGLIVKQLVLHFKGNQTNWLRYGEQFHLAHHPPPILAVTQLDWASWVIV